MTDPSVARRPITQLLSRRPPHPRVALVLVLLAVVLVQLLTYPGRFDRDPVMLGPLDNIRFELAQRWVCDGAPSLSLAGAADVPDDVAPALTPRDAAVQQGSVVPKDFPYAIGLAALLALVEPRLALALSLLSAAALTMAVAALACRLGGPWSGVAAAVLLATTTAFVAGTIGLLNTGATLAATVVLGLRLLLPPGDTPVETAMPDRRRDVLAGATFGLGIGLHHDVILLVAGLVFPFLIRPLGTPARMVNIVAGVAIATAPVPVYYAWLHGSPFTTGYAVGAQALAMPGERLFDVFTLDDAMLLEHLRHYVVRPEMLLLLFASLLAYRRPKLPVIRNLIAGSLLGGLPYLVFAGARPLYGVDRFNLEASFPRYSLPVVAIIVCIAATGPRGGPGLSRSAWAAALTVSAMIGVILLLGGAPGGPLDQRQQVLRSAHLRAEVLQVVEPDALVITARGDKLLWPHRPTITAAYLVRTPLEGVRSGPAMYDVLPTPRRLAEVAARLISRGQRVFLLSDALPPHMAGLDLELRLAGLKREPTPTRSLFRVTVA